MAGGHSANSQDGPITTTTSLLVFQSSTLLLLQPLSLSYLVNCEGSRLKEILSLTRSLHPKLSLYLRFHFICIYFPSSTFLDGLHQFQRLFFTLFIFLKFVFFSFLWIAVNNKYSSKRDGDGDGAMGLLGPVPATSKV